MNYLSMDFEYKGTNEPLLDLVCCALTNGKQAKAIWLHNHSENKTTLKNFLLSKRETHTLLVWNYDAEGRSLISLGLNPAKFKCIDLQAEYKCLINHNDKLGYGKQFIDGKFKTTYRRKNGDDRDKRPHVRASSSLLSATYKLLRKGSVEEYEHKNEMRDLILGTKEYNQDQRGQILDYCTGDIGDLHDIYLAIVKEYRKLLRKEFDAEQLHKDMLWRGETVARASMIASVGYPVNRKKVYNFARNVPNILKDLQEDINEQFPDSPPFYWNKKADRYSLNTKSVKSWVAEESGLADKWMKTQKDAISLKLEAFERHYTFRHNYPKGDFAAQFLRYLRIKQNLNGFVPKSVTAKNKQTFFSYYGSDDRAHPYLNAYGSQSARYQPKAIGFLHLKAAWMRSLVEPKPGRAICGIDYGSEEFLLAALLSKDENMLAAYESGDVYLYFAKLAGAVPWDGEKKDYKEERNRFKSTTLGISYLMGAAALSRKLKKDTGIDHTTEEAAELIDKFYTAFPAYRKWIEDTQHDYAYGNEKIRLPCGWWMWGDNDNARSVSNMPIQGLGSSILRLAIKLAQDAGLCVILPLHDALYIEYDSDDLEAPVLLEECMRHAFAHYFEGEYKEIAKRLIRLDVDIWGPDYNDETISYGGLTMKKQNIYIDERAGDEYKKFKKYLDV